MWPTWWWPQALMQPLILIFSSPIVVLARGVGEALGDVLRDRDRAGVGERAVVEARAGDDVADQVEVGVARPSRPARRQTAGRSLEPHVRQDQVLLVGHADLVEGCSARRGRRRASICSAVASPGGCRRSASATILTMRVARLLVRRACCASATAAKARSARVGASTSATTAGRCEGRAARSRRDAVELGVGQVQRAVAGCAATPPRPGGELLGAELVHQDLDPRLVDVVAPAVAVVDAQDRLQVGQQVASGRNSRIVLAMMRRAAQAAADHHLEAHLAVACRFTAQADVVHADGGAVVAASR